MYEEQIARGVRRLDERLVDDDGLPCWRGRIGKPLRMDDFRKCVAGQALEVKRLSQFARGLQHRLGIPFHKAIDGVWHDNAHLFGFRLPPGEDEWAPGAWDRLEEEWLSGPLAET